MTNDQTRTYFGLELLVGFLALAACYLYFDAIGPISQYGSTLIWSRPANINDHLVYFDWANHRPISALAAGDNNFGISWLFLNLVDRYDEFQIFVLNMIFMLIGFYAYCRICRYYGLGPQVYILFLANTFLLYFGLLINKDMATFMIVMLSAWFMLSGARFKLLALIPFAFVVRQQMAMFIVVLMFLESPFLSFRLKVVAVLVGSSILGVVLLRAFNFIDLRTLGEGITGEMSQFFLEQQWLAPLGLPLRLMLYVFDYFSSLAPMSFGHIDALKALRLPSIIFFFVAMPYLIRSFLNPARYTSVIDYRPLLSTTVAFLAALLINPQINARYLTSLIPLLILLVMIMIRKVPYSIYIRRLELREAHSGSVLAS